MKSKRAAASTEDSNPVDVSLDKKRKRTDEDGASSSKSVKKYKEAVKEKRQEKKEKKEKREAKEERAAKKPKKDKSKYNNKTRKEKKDERKNIQDLPEDADESSEGGAAVAEPAVAQPETKTNGDANKDKKKKEKKKAEKESKDVPQGEDAIDLDASTAAKPGRNIVFVGNLPYTATAATITAHFASLKPVAVRCLTKKEDPKMCRGIAFVEFSSPAHQRTCLDKFHHSMFEDGISEPRRINVELTAGGGGRGQGRQGKILEKNKKLDENRAKRIEKEKLAKEENQGDGGSNARMDIHPSRLARLSGFQN
ncbi:hypothetical protein ACQKWADRAFT_306495 [Trichoderma austrokoningii]